MTVSENHSTTNNLEAEDIAKLAAIQRSNEGLRAVLCTLARRGVAFRQSYPERAQAILQTLSPYPVYKGGQFLFDLMEWEDFMLDGDPPEIVSTDFLGTLPESISNVFKSIENYLNPDNHDNLIPPQTHESTFNFSDSQLPVLESSFYLYQDVILGWFSSLPANPAPTPSPSQPVLPQAR